MVVQIRDTEHLKEELGKAGDKLVVVDFFATWCGPCKQISPKFIEFEKEFEDVVFLKVDVDECEEIAGEYNIASMPTFVFIKNQKPIDNFSGANDKKLKEKIEQLK